MLLVGLYPSTQKPYMNYTAVGPSGETLYPSLIADFVNNIYTRSPFDNSGNIFPKTFSDIFNFASRPSTATYYDKFGVLQTAASGVMRTQCHDPSTVVKRTNYELKSDFNGLVIGDLGGGGTGALPSGWTYFEGSGVQIQIVDKGIDANGFHYMDFRYYGTPGGSSGSALRPSTITLESPMDVMTMSAEVQMIAGSTSGFYGFQMNADRTGASKWFNPISSVTGRTNLGTGNPFVMSGTLSATSGVTAFKPIFEILFNGGSPIDITIRIKKIQVEKGSTVTEFIPANGQATSVYSSFAKPLGLHIEESRTNIYGSSNAFPTGWSSNVSPVAGGMYLAPDGTVTARHITTSNSSVSGYWRAPTLSGDTTYTFSIFMKYVAGEPVVTLGGENAKWVGTSGASDMRIRCNLQTGQITNATAGCQRYGVQSIGNGWYRFWVSGTTITDPGFAPMSIYGVTNSLVREYLVWGAQFETGQYPSSLIPTPTTSSVTRAAEDLYSTIRENATQPNYINRYGSTILTSHVVSNAGFLMGLGENDSGNNPRAHTTSSPGSAFTFMWASGAPGGVNVSAATNTTYGSDEKMCWSWSADQRVVVSNGTFISYGGTLTYGNDFPLRRMALGRRYGLTSSYFNSYIKYVVIYPYTLSVSEHQRLSTL